MTRFHSLSLTLLTVSTLSFAQTAQQPGGWRRVGDPPPSPVEAAPPPEAAPPVMQDQDPSQPVARNDEYGQPQQPQMQQPQMQQQRSYQPAPQPYGLPAQVTIPGGTYVTVRINQGLSSDRNQAGDVFTGQLEQPIVVDGIVLAQRGQNIIGRVVDAGKDGRTTRLGLEMTAITVADGSQINVGSQMVVRKGPSNAGRDVGTVATTTVAGAAIGGIADYGRGAAIGAGAGAAAGIIGVLLTPGRPTVVYPESVLTFRLDAPVRVNTGRAPQAYRYVAPNEFEQPIQSQVARRPMPPPRPVVAPAPYYGPGPYVYPYPAFPYPYYGYPYYGGVDFGVVIRTRPYYGRRW